MYPYTHDTGQSQARAMTVQYNGMLYILLIYGPNSAGRKICALGVTNLASLQESPSPNCWSGKLVLCISMVCKYLAEFLPSWDARKRVQESVEVF